MKRTHAALWLAAIVVVKGALVARARWSGFGSLSADEFSRGISALHWAQYPQWLPLSSGLWMPAEQYLNGFAMLFGAEPLATQRFTAFVAAVVLAVFHTLFAARLFPERGVAALSFLLAAVFPWSVWLSGTAMLDGYYLAAFFAGLYFLSARRLIASSVAFFLACSFHVQAWIAVASVGAYVLYHAYRHPAERRRWLGFAASLAAYPVLYSIGMYLTIGSVLRGFQFGSGSTAEYFARMGIHFGYSYYLQLFLNEAGTPFCLALVTAVFFMRRNALRLEPLVVAGIALLAYTASLLVTVPSAAAPGRYAAFLVLLLIPYVARAIALFFPRSTELAVVGTLVTLLLCGTWLQRAGFYPGGVPERTVTVGREVGVWLRSLDGTPRVLVDDQDWEALVVGFASARPAQILSDMRLPGSEAAQRWSARAISSLIDDDEKLLATAATHGARYLLARQPPLVQRLAQSRAFTECGCNAYWRVYCAKDAPGPQGPFWRCR